MPSKYLAEQEKQVSELLRRNTLIATACVAAGFSLLIPAFSLAGSRFDQQEFCFSPKYLSHPEQHDFCTGGKIRRGVAWRVAQEVAESQQFKAKVSLLTYIPAQNPHAGLYGLLGAGFFFGAFVAFKTGTNKLEDTLDTFVWNKKATVYERAFQNNLHLEIESQKKENEAAFIKELLTREHGAALLELMSDQERQLAAERYAKGEKLDEANFELQLATLKAEAAAQAEKEAKHQAEVAKLSKPKKKGSGSAETTGNEAAKQELIENLKEHEGGWLHTLCTTRKVLIIEGEMGSFKSYTAALIAFCRYHLCGHKLGWIVDSDYHQNKKKAWHILQGLEFDAYGANKNGEGIREGLERFLNGIEVRDEDNCEIETIIFDELTTYGDYPESEDISKSFMKFALSAPRKANYGLIAITHSMTNEGTGKGGGMAEARKRGSLHLLLNADNDCHPTFKGVLNGFKDESGQLLENMPVTLPDWFRPSKLASMLGGKNGL